MEVMMDQNDFNKTVIVSASFTDIEMMTILHDAFYAQLIDKLVSAFMEKHGEDIVEKLYEGIDLQQATAAIQLLIERKLLDE